MDHTYQRPLQLPAGYSVLSAEEMTYTEGGALSINITPEQVMTFGMNVVVNLVGVMGRYAFQSAVSGMQNALNDGLSVGDAVGHYWGKLNWLVWAATMATFRHAAFISLSRTLCSHLKIPLTSIRPIKRLNRRLLSSRTVCPRWWLCAKRLIDPERSVFIYEKASAAFFLCSPLP